MGFDQNLHASSSKLCQQPAHLRLCERMQMCFGAVDDHNLTFLRHQQGDENWKGIRQPKPDIRGTALGTHVRKLELKTELCDLRHILHIRSRSREQPGEPGVQLLAQRGRGLVRVSALFHHFIVDGPVVPVGSEAPIRADIGDKRVSGIRTG